MTETYRVQLDAFEGPLDLLLYLIRKHEVDIHDIPIAPITDDFLDHLEHLDRVDIDVAGEFLVMAATLMEIKSRWLDRVGNPEVSEEEAPDPESADDPLDPRADLVRQLLDYKRHRDAAEVLEDRRQAWARRFPSAPAGLDQEDLDRAADELGELEIEDLDLHDLVEAFSQIVSSVNFDRLGEHEVIADDTPIELHAADIVDRLARTVPAGGGERAMTLRSILDGRTRAEMVGLFLALLTLVRDQKVGVRSEGGRVSVELRDDQEQDS